MEAKEMNVPVKEFCDKNAEKFKNLFDLVDIDYDLYVRTSSGDHKEFVQKYWEELSEKKKIIKS